MPLPDIEDLGFHTGMITDGLMRLVNQGVATGRHKELDAGMVVAGTALGSSLLYKSIPELPVRFLPTSYTHSPQVLSQLPSLVSVNFAVEVDLSGQVGAEVSGGVYVGAVGGQVDFTRAAALTGKRSIIALRSTFRGRSTIKPRLDGGVVTTARADVDVVVTEYGAAHLRGQSIDERARRLVTVAAPEFRDELREGDQSAMSRNFRRRVHIREVGPRDGFQNEPEVISTADKISLINQLGQTGLDRIEVASFVRPDVIPQLSDAVEVLQRHRRSRPRVTDGAGSQQPRPGQRAEGA